MGSTSSRSSPAAVIPDGRTVPAIEVRDVAPAWGVTRSNRYGGAAGKKFILEMTGNGAAIFDFDRDGRLDIVLANGPGMDQQPASAVVVYRNEGTEGFRDVTDRAAPDLTGWAQGICAGDFDGDGFTDLFVTYYGQNRLLRNHRGERLQDVTANSGLEYAPLRFGTG